MTCDHEIWSDGERRVYLFWGEVSDCVWVAARRDDDRLELFGWGIMSLITGGALTFDGAVRKALKWARGSEGEEHQLAQLTDRARLIAITETPLERQAV